jgi:hypothetical protein
VSATAVLRRLHDAGVDVQFQAPDQIVLRGPVTDELIEAARAAKPELLTLVRPRPAAVACACCGRFYFAEPAALCFWCRPRKYGDNRDRSAPQDGGGTTSVPSVPAFPEPPEKRACPSCGGGLGATDPDGGACWSCRRIHGGAQ